MFGSGKAVETAYFNIDQLNELNNTGLVQEFATDDNNYINTLNQRQDNPDSEFGGTFDSKNDVTFGDDYRTYMVSQHEYVMSENSFRQADTNYNGTELENVDKTDLSYNSQNNFKDFDGGYAGYYQGTYDFKEQENLFFPDYENFYDNSASGCGIWVVSDIAGHNKVLKMSDPSVSGTFILGIDFEATEYLIMEFWMYFDDANLASYMYFKQDTTLCVQIRVSSNILYYYDKGSSSFLTTGKGISDDTWYHCKILLDATTDKYTIYLDNDLTNCNNKDIYTPVSYFNSFQTNGGGSSQTYNNYFDAIGYSFDSGYFVDYNINPYGNGLRQKENFDFDIDPNCAITLIDDGNHDNALHLIDDSTIGNISATYSFGENIWDNRVSFWLKNDGVNKAYVYFYFGSSVYKGLYLIGTNLYLYTSKLGSQLIASGVSEWNYYDVHIDSIDTYTIELWLNGAYEGSLGSYYNPMTKMSVISSTGDSGSDIYFDALNYDWIGSLHSNRELSNFDELNRHGYEGTIGIGGTSDIANFSGHDNVLKLENAGFYKTGNSLFNKNDSFSFWFYTTGNFEAGFVLTYTTLRYGLYDRSISVRFEQSGANDGSIYLTYSDIYPYTNSKQFINIPLNSWIRCELSFTEITAILRLQFYSFFYQDVRDVSGSVSTTSDSPVYDDDDFRDVLFSCVDESYIDGIIYSFSGNQSLDINKRPKNYNYQTGWKSLTTTATLDDGGDYDEYMVSTVLIQHDNITLTSIFRKDGEADIEAFTDFIEYDCSESILEIQTHFLILDTDLYMFGFRIFDNGEKVYTYSGEYSTGGVFSSDYIEYFEIFTNVSETYFYNENQWLKEQCADRNRQMWSDAEFTAMFNMPSFYVMVSFEPPLEPDNRPYWIYWTSQITFDEYETLTARAELEDNRSVDFSYDFALAVVELVEARFYYYQIDPVSWGDWGLFNVLRDAVAFILNLVLLALQFIVYFLLLAFNFIFMFIIVGGLLILVWNILLKYLLWAGLWVLVGLYLLIYLVLPVFLEWLFETIIPVLLDILIYIFSIIVATLIWLFTFGQGNFTEIVETIEYFLDAIFGFFYDVMMFVLGNLLHIIIYFGAYILILYMLYGKFLYAKAKGWSSRQARLAHSYTTLAIPIKWASNTISILKRVIPMI